MLTSNLPITTIDLYLKSTHPDLPKQLTKHPQPTTIRVCLPNQHSRINQKLYCRKVIPIIVRFFVFAQKILEQEKHADKVYPTIYFKLSRTGGKVFSFELKICLECAFVICPGMFIVSVRRVYLIQNCLSIKQHQIVLVH